jgi:hypothetical protein
VSQQAGEGTSRASARLALPCRLGGPGEPKVRFTRPGMRALYLLLLGFYAFLLFGGAVTVGVPWWARVLACLGILVLALLGWRVLRLAVIATPECLVIRNLRNTHCIPWHAVEEIFRPGPVPSAVYPENPLAERKFGLFVRLKEGAVISCTLYGKSLMRRWPSNWPVIDEVIANLDELRSRYTGGEPASSDVAGSGPDLLS